MAERKQKTYTGTLRLKAAGDGEPTGEVVCEFATLGVVDHDGDLTEAGAFAGCGEVVLEPWNHNYGVLPVGKGAIREEDDKAVFEGAFFLDTQAGQEHYNVVKALGDLQEWSYTFQVLESGQAVIDDKPVFVLKKLDVWGVAPVTRGAGIDTRTVEIKRRKRSEIVQQAHDLLVELGAKCDHGDEGGEEDEAGGDAGKSGLALSTLAAELDVLLEE